MGFNVTCTPGPDAAAGFRQLGPDLPALVIFTDPVNIVFQLPPFPGGDLALARFCRELSREAARLAEVVDPDGEPAPPEPDLGRHSLVVRQDFGESGGGA